MGRIRHFALLWLFLGTAALVLGQNVGIGTASPSTKLHVASSASQDGLRIDNTGFEGNPILQFALSGQVGYTLGIDDRDGDKWKLSTGASLGNGAAMTITRNGYIGIGTNNPAYNLELQQTRPGDYVARFQNTAVDGPGLGAHSSNTFNAIGGSTDNHAGIGVYGVHLPATGVGWGVLGSSNSSDGIGVRGTVPTTGTWLGYGGYFAGGLAYVNGLYNLSDARMKTNVRPLQGALATIGQLRGVSFQYNQAEYSEFVGHDDRTYLGFVAQEVEAVLPEAVAEKYLIGQDGGIATLAQENAGTTRQTVKVVDYVSMIPVLVEAIKEQQAYIQQLEQRLQQLEQEKH
jgi:Chaperone of endosialidase